MALAIQPAYIAALSVNSFGKIPCNTTSETQKCPPGFRTRRISLKMRSFLGRRFRTQLLTTTSAVSFRTGMFSMSPSLNSTLSQPRFAALARALASICGEKSIPMTLPSAPVSARAMKQSFPAPDPRSMTVSPGLIRAYRVGSPHPTPRSASGS